MKTLFMPSNENELHFYPLKQANDQPTLSTHHHVKNPDMWKSYRLFPTDEQAGLKAAVHRPEFTRFL